MPLFVEVILQTNKIVLFQVSGVEVRMIMQWGHLEDRPLQVRWVEMRMVAMIVKIRQVVKDILKTITKWRCVRTVHYATYYIRS